jgi:copper chaperone CopZ
MKQTTRRNWMVGVAAAATLAWLGGVTAQTTSNTPRAVLTIPDLHCPGCAKGVEKKLLQVPGVVAASSNLADKTIAVQIRPEALPSPKAMWEAVEKAGKKPTKLVCPQGAFTSKPDA